MSSNIPGEARPSIPAFLDAGTGPETPIADLCAAWRYWINASPGRLTFEIQRSDVLLFLADREEAAKEIARLTKEWEDFAELVRDYAAVESPQALVTIAEDRDHWFKLCARHEAEIARLKSELAIAETATRKALESVPIAMTAARDEEREACAKVVELGLEDDPLDEPVCDSALIRAAAAIRARASEVGHE